MPKERCYPHSLVVPSKAQQNGLKLVSGHSCWPSFASGRKWQQRKVVWKLGDGYPKVIARGSGGVLARLDGIKSAESKRLKENLDERAFVIASCRAWHSLSLLGFVAGRT